MKNITPLNNEGDIIAGQDAKPEVSVEKVQQANSYFALDRTIADTSQLPANPNTPPANGVVANEARAGVGAAKESWRRVVVRIIGALSFLFFVMATVGSLQMLLRPQAGTEHLSGMNIANTFLHALLAIFSIGLILAKRRAAVCFLVTLIPLAIVNTPVILLMIALMSIGMGGGGVTSLFGFVIVAMFVVPLIFLINRETREALD